MLGATPSRSRGPALLKAPGQSDFLVGWADQLVQKESSAERHKEQQQANGGAIAKLTAAKSTMIHSEGGDSRGETRPAIGEYKNGLKRRGRLDDGQDREQAHLTQEKREVNHQDTLEAD